MADLTTRAFCYDVLVLNGTSRDANAELCAQLTAPHTGGKDDGFGAPMALGCLHARNAFVGDIEIRDLDALADIGPLPTRDTGNGLTERCRIHIPIRRNECSAFQPGRVDQWKEVLGLGG